MHILYDTALNIWNTLILLLSKLTNGKSKTSQYFKGTAHAIEDWKKQITDEDTIWVHCASLGELGVVRPVVKELKRILGYRIVITFFSPTGVNALKNKLPNEIDAVGYLPTDTASNAKELIKILHPKFVIWAVSEYWINYLEVLKQNKIPTYLVGALFSGKEPHCCWYGGLYRKSLDAYTTIFALNNQTKNRLSALGYARVKLMGDPLFDNAINIANTEYANDIVEHFSQEGQLMVIGSLSDENDLELTAYLANTNPDLRLLIVPHEVDNKWLCEIEKVLQGKSIRYSKCNEATSLKDVQSLIIDYVGDLAKLYRYGTWAYVGGGFTPYLHSVIEATVYGLSVAFGPRIERKETPRQMIERGIGTLVTNGKELQQWWLGLNEPQIIQDIKIKALNYTQQNSGATHEIVQQIIQSK